MFGMILGVVLVSVAQTSQPLSSQPPAIALYTEQDVPQLQFAATELRRACLAQGLPLIERSLQQLDADEKQGQAAPDQIILLSRAPNQQDQAFLQALKAPEQPSPQAYAIRRVEKAPGQRITVVLGADPIGAMYGGIDLAEAVRLGRLAEVQDADHAPAILRRGIKFNAPLDLRTPSYSDNSDAAQANIPEMWSLDFWQPFLDEMARDRYNVLTLWSLHPFPSLVKVPEYPEVALEDVQRTRLPLDDTFSHMGHDMVRPEMLEDVEVVKHLSIDDKIAFWRQVMQYAHDRGIEVYLFTWNIFTFGADGKYGITPAQDNQKTIDYFRASVRETVRTYPLLAGFGITAGERMEKRDDQFAKEPWLWKTYGQGILDALEAEPGRSVRLIHRFHQTGQSEILDAWKDYPQPIDLSFKYAIAHMYSSPSPPFLKPIEPQLPAGRRLWLTVRNDDIYSFRWGDPTYVREFLSNLPGPEILAGFYMGPDGTTWGRETLSRLPAVTPRELEIQKHWFSFWLWGRLSYDPNLPDALIERLVASRFPEANGHALLETWSRASRIIPQITRFFWGDIDLKWFPEACLSHPRHKGFYTVKDFVEGQTMPGAGIASIRQWREKAGLGRKVEGITPLEVADNLEADGKFTLDQVANLRLTIDTSPELDRTLADLEAMAWLGLYYAEKIRCASALGLYDLYSRRVDRLEALERAEAASERWSQYAAFYDAQYRPQLRNRVGIVNIPALQEKVNDDIQIVRNWKPGTVPPGQPKPKGGDQPFRP